MFQKVSILASVNKGFTGYERLYLEIVLQKDEINTAINSSFTQNIYNKKRKETITHSMEIESFSRKNRLSSAWWKGENEKDVCSFEFLNKDYQDVEINIEITNNNETIKKQVIQPLTEGHFTNEMVEYTIKMTM
jgi:hypothetical protein